MKKNTNRNTWLTINTVCIITTAFFLAACIAVLVWNVI